MDIAGTIYLILALTLIYFVYTLNICSCIKVGLWIHITYAYLISQYISGVYDIYIKAYQQVPEEVANKYKAFHRSEAKNLKKWKIQLGAIYVLPIRMFFFLIFMTMWMVQLMISTRGLDPNKPYPSKTRRTIERAG